MKSISVKKEANQFVIAIDESMVDKDVLISLVERLKQEFLVRKSETDPAVLELGEDIKKSWWEQNKDRILQSGS